MTKPQSLNNYKVKKSRADMDIEWGTQHTKIAKKIEKHLESPKPKMYTSYNAYMKALHAKTS